MQFSVLNQSVREPVPKPIFFSSFFQLSCCWVFFLSLNLRSLERVMFYGAVVWDPWLIVAQIVCLQCLYYLTLGVFLAILVGTRVSRMSLVYFFDYAAVTASTITGWCVIAAFILSSLAGAGFLVYLVERAKKCLDFTATLYIIHVFICIFYGGWPSSITWWIVNGTGLAIMALLGEYLCIKRELREIPTARYRSSTNAYPDFTNKTVPSKDTPGHTSLRNDVSSIPPSTSTVLKSSFYDFSSSSGRKDMLPVDLYQDEVKTSLVNDNNKIIKDEWSVKPLKKDGFDSLESIVVVKEAEVRMFQNRADEARIEAESFRRQIRIKGEKLEVEYAEKLAKLCLQEAEEKGRKKFEDLKASENSHCDYYKMKMRMQAEIAGLLKRMELTKQQWV